MITWDQEDTINYGLVGQNLCPNCLSTPFWFLKKVSKCISIFFIPILPIESEYWFQCPICNYALSMDRDEFKIYKLIAKTNTSFNEGDITEEQRLIKLEKLYTKVDKIQLDKRMKYVIESEEWVDLASRKSNEELYSVIFEKRDEYNPAFLIAVEMELEKRKVKRSAEKLK